MRLLPQRKLLSHNTEARRFEDTENVFSASTYAKASTYAMAMVDKTVDREY